MQRIARVGKVEDQDRLRSSDCLRMTPHQRVDALLAFRDRFFGDAPHPLVRTVKILRRGRAAHG